MICNGAWRKAAFFKSNYQYNLPVHKMLTTDLSRVLKSPEIQRTLRAPCKKIHCRVLKKKPLKNPRIMLKLNPYARTMHWNTILLQAKNHGLQLDEAGAALKAKSDEEGIPDKKPMVGRGGKRKRPQLPRTQQLRRTPPPAPEEKKPDA